MTDKDRIEAIAALLFAQDESTDEISYGDRAIEFIKDDPATNELESLRKENVELRARLESSMPMEPVVPKQEGSRVWGVFYDTSEAEIRKKFNENIKYYIWDENSTAPKKP